MKVKPLKNKYAPLIILFAELISFLSLCSIVTNSLSTPPVPGYTTVYESQITSTNFVLNTSAYPINQLASNVRFFQYPNLTSPVQSFLGQEWSTTTYPYGGFASVYPESNEIGITTVPQVTLKISNTQSVATPAPFQQLVNLTKSELGSSLFSYIVQHPLGIYFYQLGVGGLYAWIENITSNYLLVWVKLPNGIPPSSSVTIYMSITGSIQYPYTGISPLVAQKLSMPTATYDNGADVFDYYFPGYSDSGWTISGSAGITTSAPSGSPFGPDAFYANSASGDYMYIDLQNWMTSGSYIIQYYVYTTGLGDFFFVANSGGTGVMNRLDSRGGGNYIGLAKTLSWTGWYAPESGITASPKVWYLQSIVIVNGQQVGSYINNVSTFSQLGKVVNPISTTYNDDRGTETFAEQGSYIGLVGDQLGSSYITYWNGIIIRAYPPNGVMPTVTVVSTPSSSTSTLLPTYLSPYYIFCFTSQKLDVGSFVESTAWSPSPTPYYSGGELVINTTHSTDSGQYIGWVFTPSSTELNLTIHVTSFPDHVNNSGLVIYSPNVGNQTTDFGGWYALLIDFCGNAIYFHSPTTNWYPLYTSLPQPNPNYPFTFTAILTENSYGNITVSQIGINGTYTSVNVNTPYPWSDIGYVGIRGDIGNLFYVSYYAVSSGSATLILVPSSTVHAEPLTSYPLPQITTNATIILSNIDGQTYLSAITSPQGTFFYDLPLITKWEPIGIIGAYSVSQLLTVISLPKAPVYMAVFPTNITFNYYTSYLTPTSIPSTVITPSFTTAQYPVLSEGSAGTITLWTPAGSVSVSGIPTLYPLVGGYYTTTLSMPSSINILVNGTVRSYTISGNTVSVTGLTGTTTLIFPDDLIPPISATQYNATFDEIKTTASSITFYIYSSFVEGGVPVGNLITPYDYVGLYSGSVKVQVPVIVMPTLLGNRLVGWLPEAISTAWSPSPTPYYSGGELVINTTHISAPWGQYIAWAFTPSSTILNLTIHVTSFPDRNYNPGLVIYSPNVGNQTTDFGGWYALLIDFCGNAIYFHSPTTNWYPLYTSLPQPNPNYPFTFTAILTENSYGNITVSQIGINGTYTSVNVNTPYPWSDIGYVGIRGDIGNLFYVSYYAVSEGSSTFDFVSPSSTPLLEAGYSYAIPFLLNYQFSLPFTLNSSTVTVGAYSLSQGINYIAINGQAGYIFSSALYYNNTDFPVLANLISPYVTYHVLSSLSYALQTPLPALYYNIFPIPTPQIIDIFGFPYSSSAKVYYVDPSIYPTSSSINLAFLAKPLGSVSYSSSNSTTLSSSSSSPPPSTTTSSSYTVSPSTIHVVYNGSTFITVAVPIYPDIHTGQGNLVAMPFTNSSGAYLYLYYYNQSSTAKATVLIYNGSTLVKNETVQVNSVVALPTSNSTTYTVKIEAFNNTVSFNVSPLQLSSVPLNIQKAISNALSGTQYAIFSTLLFVVLMGAIGLSAILRNDLKLMGIGGIAFSVFVGPGLLELGFPSDIVVPEMIVGFTIGIYAFWTSGK